MKPAKTFARVTWCAEDVKTLRADWSTRRCNEFLAKHSGHLQDAMIETGWQVLECALDSEEDGL